MKGDRSGGVIGVAVGRWSDLDSDWQGVLVGVTIVVLVGLFGVDVPW